jgi:hypothetical protein
MAAVLARKQAEPLMLELLHQGQVLRDRLEEGEEVLAEHNLPREKLPAPVSRLVQCLVEEAEATPETTTQALKLIAFFARGCHTQDDWRALAKGPYGAELLQHSWSLFSSPKSKESNTFRTCTYIAAARFGKKFADKANIDPELLRLLTSTTEEEISQGLFIVAGRVVEDSEVRRHVSNGRLQLTGELIEYIEKHFFAESTAIKEAAIWTWALVFFYCKAAGQPTADGLDRILDVWLTSPDEELVEIASAALWTQLGLERKKWKPVLHERDVEKIKRMSDNKSETMGGHNANAASLMAAFHAGTVWSDDELVSKLTELRKEARYSHRRDGMDPVQAMLKQLKPNRAKRSSKRTLRKPRK